MKYYLFTLLLLAAACSQKKEESPAAVNRAGVFFNDFESEMGWGTCESNSISTEMAHSGKYAVKLDQNHEFGMGFTMPMGKMVGTKPKKIEVEAWVYLPTRNINPTLVIDVVSAQDNNNHVLYQEINLVEKASEIRQWVKVSQSFDIPEAVNFTDILKVYPWRHDSRDNIFIDDLKISVTE